VGELKQEGWKMGSELNKDGGPAVTPGYYLELIYKKIDSGSDIIINSLSSENLIVGRPVRVDGKTVTVSSEGREVVVKISDILDIN